MIEVKNLSKYYSESAAIKDISFDIAEGEIVGLLGLNGAGKSTILKILGSFLKPSAGIAKIRGYSVDENPDAVRELIGFLPDSPPLYNEMNVVDYLKYVAELKKVPKQKIDSYIADAIRQTNLIDVADSRLGDLSHGFRQRVGIAQAIVHKPKVLIFDEPNNGLDPIQVREMRDLITSLRGRHTVILSSHILSEITKTCDRVLIVDQGQLVAQGDEASLSSHFMNQIKIKVIATKVAGSCLKALEQLEQVSQVETQSIGSEQTEIQLLLKSDIRSEIARIIVTSGSDLWEMSREEGGLESIFMKLVKPRNIQPGGANP
jgi:ABC-2 type transport system ATP-binding protein